MKTKSSIIILVLITFNIITVAQNITIKYSYDASGNRIKRELLAQEVQEPENIAIPQQPEQQKELVELLQQPLANATPSNAVQEAFTVLVYPNPSRGVYTLELPELQDDERGTVQVYSTLGRLVRKQRGVHRVQSVNITSAMPGYYLLQVTVEGKVVTRTLIKQ